MMDSYVLAKLHEHNRAELERTRGVRDWRRLLRMTR
jgi:hypothetical protein